jgi:hypothetical protein
MFDDDDDDGNGFHPIMNIMEVVLTLPIKAKRTTFNWMYIDYNITKCSFRQWPTS